MNPPAGGQSNTNIRFPSRKHPAQTPSNEHRAILPDVHNLLRSELAFYEQLELLLTEMVTANLFSTEAATTLNRAIDDLQRQRDELRHDRERCQAAIAKVLKSSAGEARISDLEPHLSESERGNLRRQRLQLTSRVEGMHRQLRRTELLLSSRHFLFADLITALTGQSPSANCYGANGRRETYVPTSITQAVS